MRPAKLLTTAYVALLAFWAIASYMELTKLHVERWPLCADFVKFYTCGLLAENAHHLAIYDPKTQLDVCYQALAKYSNVTERVPIYIQYFPVTFVLMIPFALIPMKESFIIWTLVAPLVALPLLWKASSPYGNWKFSTALIIGLIASVPAYHNYWFGQLAWFYLALMIGIWLAFRSGHEKTLGGVMALSIIKPQYAIFLLPMILFKRHAQAIATCGVVGIAIMLITTLILGLPNVLGYPTALHFAETDGAEISGLHAEMMIGVRGLLSLFLPQNIALPISSACALAGVAACWFIWNRANKTSDDRSSPIFAWAMSLTCVMSIAVGLHEREYDPILLALPAALTLMHQPQEGENKHALIIWKGILIALPAVSWLAFLFLYPFKLYSPALTMLIFLLLICGLKYYSTLKHQT